jgi:hypothetical protein
LLAGGYGVARYVSVEQRIYESENAYYASLYKSQQDRHASEHSIWPWTSYFVRLLDGAYEDFEQRVATADQNSGNKQERVPSGLLCSCERRVGRTAGLRSA